jgi:hypothetical protein
MIETCKTGPGTTSVLECRANVEHLSSHVAVSEWSEKRPIVDNRFSSNALQHLPTWIRALSVSGHMPAVFLGSIDDGGVMYGLVRCKSYELRVRVTSTF